MSVWRWWWWWWRGWAPEREAMGELFFCRGGGCWVGVEGRAGEGKGLERYVWGAAELGGRGVCGGVGGFSRIDQALEEADCATFEDEGTITLLGSVSRRRGSQTTRGKAL